MSDKTKRLYRNPENGLIFGVCAGIADFTAIPIGMVRLLWVIGNVFFFPLFFVYLFMGFTLSQKPQDAPYNAQALHADIEELDQHFKHLQQKIGRMEHYVTSDEFAFQRKLWDLRK